MSNITSNQYDETTTQSVEALQIETLFLFPEKGTLIDEISQRRFALIQVLGGYGSGKSHLANEIGSMYAVSPRTDCTVIDCAVPSDELPFIDLIGTVGWSENLSEDQQTLYHALIQKIEAFKLSYPTINIDEELSDSLTKIRRAGEKPTRSPWYMALREISNDFNAVIDSQRDRHKLIVLDNGHFLTRSRQQFLEEFVIPPLHRRGNSHLVKFSARPGIWLKPEYRNVSIDVPLSNLSSENVRVFLKNKFGVPEDFAGYVYYLTRGNRGALASVIEEITLISGEDGTFDNENFLLRVYMGVLRDFIISGIKPNMSEDVYEGFVAASTLRSLDYVSLQLLVNKMRSHNQQDEGELSLAESGILLSRMKASRMPFIEWNSLNRLGVKIEHPLREITQACLTVLNPELSKALHSSAVEYYGGVLERPVASRPEYIIEELYHLTFVGGFDVLINTLRERLKFYDNLGNDNRASEAAYNKLSSYLYSDPDLKYILTDDQMKLLLDEINSRKGVERNGR